MNQNALIRKNESPYFSRYGKQFQEGVFQGLLSDHVWAAQMIEVMEPDYFDIKYLAYLADKYFGYYKKYKTFPTLGLLVTIIKDDLSQGNDSILRDQIVEFLHRVKANPNPGDQKYVKDKSLDFCKRQARVCSLAHTIATSPPVTQLACTIIWNSWNCW